jgi:DNA polymerase-1
MVKLVTNQTSIEPTFELATIEECVNYVSTKTVLGLDIETTRKFNRYLDIEGLDPHTSDIVMLQIGTVEEQYIIDTRNVDITPLLPVLNNPDIMLVGHNIKFEYKHILRKYNVRINNLYDTMVAEKILFNGHFLLTSLKELNERYLGITVDKTIRLSFLSIRDRPFTDDEIKYGAEDIEFPLKIREMQLIDAAKKDLLNTLRLEFRFTAVLGEMEYIGINFNKEKWLNTYKENLEKYNALLLDLDKFVIDNYEETQFVNRQLDLFNPGYTCAIQWSSSKQVVAFFKYLGCCPMAKSKSTKKMTYTVEAKEVESLLVKADLDPTVKKFVELYLRTKEYEQAVTTFGSSFTKHINPITGRVHSNYNQLVNTGRISSSKPNNQNIPSKHEFRYAFDNPEGTVIVNADYSGQENIVLANKALDPDILDFYDKGMGDMHAFIAQKLFPEELSDLTLDEIKKQYPELRQIAKAAGFALAYGGNGSTIAKNLGLSVDKGDQVYEDYFKAFPGLHSYFEKVKAAALHLGYILIDEVTKRKFYFKEFKAYRRALAMGDMRTINNLQGKMERTAMNYPVVMNGASYSDIRINFA